ncbi:MGDG synthase family glycosyltransferase [Phascolarctobacterium sp.]|uniref:MGDG synthase family glycosyltransferase n=1 Tax=Phascolarctobacterium sp. TaxID=2049039 RepID=UPI003866EE24
MTKNKDKINKTVLLLSAPIGSGHKLAAEALVQVLEQVPGLRVVHGNIFDFFPGFLGTAFLKSYLWILDCCPWLYELAYKWGNKQGGSLWLRSALNNVLAYLGKGYLEKVRPDAVIATHATPAGIIGCYKKQHPQLWLGAVVTDYTIHRWWLCEGVDTYFIGDELLRDKITMGCDVQATGIPVRQAFLNLDKAACRADYGWGAEQRVCLLMGGGEGLLPMDDIMNALQGAQLNNLHLVAVTGRNEKMAATLKQRFGDTAEIYGFREDVPKMMAAADMIITKAGGLTSAEVLAVGLDFIIFKPLPGQEEGNARFLAANCGAHVAHNLAELTEFVRQAVNSEKNTHLNEHAKPQAANDIKAYILTQLEKRLGHV